MAWVSHPNTTEILRQPGYLFWNPSALTNETTWGTKLGFTQTGVKVEILPKYIYHNTEEDGDLPSIKLYAGCFVRIYATLLNYNATALARLLPGLTSGATIKIPNILKTGYNLNNVTYTDTLLFVPDDITNNNIVILQKAVPNIVDSIFLTRDKDTMFECVFDGFMKSDDVDGILYIGDITGGTIR